MKGKPWLIVAAALFALLPVAGQLGLLPPMVVGALTAAGQVVVGQAVPVEAQ